MIRFLRRWWPCLGLEHQWDTMPTLSFRCDGVASWTEEGRRCLRCRKFKGERLIEFSVVRRPEAREIRLLREEVAALRKECGK